jgi:hypothetical protein
VIEIDLEVLPKATAGELKPQSPLYDFKLNVYERRTVVH